MIGVFLASDGTNFTASWRAARLTTADASRLLLRLWLLCRDDGLCSSLPVRPLCGSSSAIRQSFSWNTASMFAQSVRQGPSWSAPYRDALAVLKLIRLFRRLRPDILHTHTPKAGILGILAGFAIGCRVRIHTY